MKILYYISGYDGCGYYRVQLPAKLLNKIPGITAKIASQYDNNDINWADIVVIQKQTNERALPYVRYAREHGKKVISEVDDCYFNLPTWNPAYNYYRNLGKELITFYRLSNSMTVTTDYLKKELDKYNPNIFVLPNSLDIEFQEKLEKMSEEELNLYTRYIDVNQKNLSLVEVKEFLKDKTTIGWGGSPTHLRDLDQATDALVKICSEDKNIIVVMMSCSTDTILKKINPKQLLLVKPSPIFRYHQVLTSMSWDIGICPIEENEFNKSKSNLKFLEFSVNGYACVCSDVENYTKTVKHGETGLLTKNTVESWYENLKILIDSPQLRKTISATAKKFVKENFNIEKNVSLWHDAYKEVLK